jgi:hypothetical protein
MCLILFAVALSQNEPTIYFESWSTDNLREAKYTFELDSSSNSRTEFVRRWNGSGYKLILTKIPSGAADHQLEYWAVDLREVLSKPGRKEVLGSNLLVREGPGPGQHVFWREDLARYLFPRREDASLLDMLLRGQSYYPVFAKRVVKVKSFYVIIEVKDYRMNQSDPKKLDTMRVEIEFANKYPVRLLCDEPDKAALSK